jgi:putative membrane protein
MCHDRCMGLIIKLAVNAVALGVAALVVSGIRLGDGTATQKIITLLVVAAIFGLVNAIIKPVVKLLSLPLFILTLGLITFVINAFMLLLTGWICDALDVPFTVDGFLAALLGGLVISFVSFLLNVLLPDELETK